MKLYSSAFNNENLLEEQFRQQILWRNCFCFCFNSSQFVFRGRNWKMNKLCLQLLWNACSNSSPQANQPHLGGLDEASSFISLNGAIIKMASVDFWDKSNWIHSLGPIINFWPTAHRPSWTTHGHMLILHCTWYVVLELELWNDLWWHWDPQNAASKQATLAVIFCENYRDFWPKEHKSQWISAVKLWATYYYYILFANLVHGHCQAQPKSQPKSQLN